MRRVLLLCLLSVASAAATSSQTQPNRPQPNQPQHQQAKQQEPRPHHIEKEWKRKEQTSPSTGYFCNSTRPSYPSGYPHLPTARGKAGLAHYHGTLITWTPNDNVTDCTIRQLYFWVDTVYQPSPSADVNIYMTPHGSTTAVKERLDWDIISIQYPGGTLYRVDAQQIDIPANPQGLQGDYDFIIDVIGTPAR